jgi:hypothetical protein
LLVKADAASPVHPLKPAYDDQPRSMRDPAVRERRKAMLNLPHMLALKTFAEKLRRPGLEVPDFDPADGGVSARALFLFEKPGPMTASGGKGKRSGSGFISRDNDDPTAEAVFKFMREAEIPRELTIMWNVIPWWNGTRAVTKTELQTGESSLSELVHLLSKLRAIMLVGKNAARAKSYCENSGLTVFTCDHPSPLVRARWPNRWSAIKSEWRKVASFIA